MEYVSDKSWELEINPIRDTLSLILTDKDIQAVSLMVWAAVKAVIITGITFSVNDEADMAEKLGLSAAGITTDLLTTPLLFLYIRNLIISRI